MNDIQIYLLDGMTVNEIVTENSDGSYTIFVNADLCPEKQNQAINHALRHINNNDFSGLDVQEIEKRAHT